MPLAPFESSIAERYHEETKYSEEGLRREQAAGRGGEWGPVPVPFKRYEGRRVLLPTAGLPLRRQDGDDDAPEGAAPPDAQIAALARVLWHTYGCTRIVRAGGGIHHFRAAPSAGAMYPAEVYVATRGVPGVEDGVHDYQILDHSLVLVRAGEVFTALATACFAHPAFAHADAAVLFTAVWQRSACRYRERGYRRALLDTGHAVGNLVEAAPREGLAAVPVACFRDELAERIVGVDPATEGVLVVAPLVPAVALDAVPPRPLHASETTEWHRALAAVGERVPAGESRRLAAALHLASRLDADATAVLAPDAPEPSVPERAVVIDARVAPTSWDDSEPVTETIAARRSTRSFRPAEIAQEALFRALAHAYGAPPHALSAPGLLRTFVVALHVVGLPPGTYAYDAAGGRLVELSRRQHDADMRHLGLGQEIFEHAAAAVIHTTDLTRAVERLGDRVYRLLGLDAGHIGERLALALLREGLGSSGCGGYYDDEMNRVLSIPESQAVVYITSVGVPE